MCSISFWRTGFYGTGAFCDEKKKLLDYFGSRKACGVKQNTVFIPLTEECHGVYRVYIVARLIPEPSTLRSSQDVCYINRRQAYLKFNMLGSISL